MKIHRIESAWATLSQIEKSHLRASEIREGNDSEREGYEKRHASGPEKSEKVAILNEKGTKKSRLRA